MDEELAECLLMWVQTFDVDGEKDSVQGLCDGAALVNILLEVSSCYFSDKLAGVKSDEASNKHIKISNLKKIMNAVFVFVKFVQFYLLIQTIFNIYRNKLVVYLSFVVLMTLYSEIC